MNIPKPIAYFCTTLQFTNLGRNEAIKLAHQNYFRPTGVISIGKSQSMAITVTEIVLPRINALNIVIESQEDTILSIASDEPLVAVVLNVNFPISCSIPGSEGVFLPFELNVIAAQNLDISLAIKKNTKYNFLCFRVTDEDLKNLVGDDHFQFNARTPGTHLAFDYQVLIAYSVTGILSEIFLQRNYMLPELTIEAWIILALTKLYGKRKTQFGRVTHFSSLVKVLLYRLHLYKNFNYPLDPNTLFRKERFDDLFYEYFGQSISTVMEVDRLRHACVMLRHSKESILAISDILGYESIGKFYEAFHAKYSVMPNEYRIRFMGFFDGNSAQYLPFNWFE